MVPQVKTLSGQYFKMKNAERILFFLNQKCLDLFNFITISVKDLNQRMFNISVPLLWRGSLGVLRSILAVAACCVCVHVNNQYKSLDIYFVISRCFSFLLFYVGIF